jgi:hypothetical protein
MFSGAGTKDLRWLLLAAVLKFAFIALLWNTIHESLRIAPQYQHYLQEWWGHPWGDTPTYFDPIDNLLNKGTYDPDYRMPGYGAVYLFFQLLLPLNAAMRMIIVFQCLMALFANFALAKVAYMITKNKIAFVVTLVICCLSLKNIKWDFTFMTESLTTSCLSIGLYFFTKCVYDEKRRTWSALCGGFFLCWAVFMRPVYFPLIVLFPLALIYLERKRVKKFGLAVMFLLPFLIVDGCWIIRNYVVLDRFVPLVKQKYIPEIADTYLGALIDFVIVTGSPVTFHDPNSELAWYVTAPGGVQTSKPPPDWLQTSQFNIDSLRTVREMIAQTEDPLLSDSSRRQLNSAITEKLERYRKSIRDEKPGFYFVGSRIRHVRTHLFTTSTDFLPPIPFLQMPLHMQIIKLSYSALYAVSVIMAIGSLGAFWLRNKDMLALPLAAMYALTISPVLGLVDVRYLAPGYPLLILCAVYFGWWLYNYKTSRTHEGSLSHSAGIQ